MAQYVTVRQGGESWHTDEQTADMMREAQAWNKDGHATQAVFDRARELHRMWPGEAPRLNSNEKADLDAPARDQVSAWRETTRRIQSDSAPVPPAPVEPDHHARAVPPVGAAPTL
jgi:hypothetical protein